MLGKGVPIKRLLTPIRYLFHPQLSRRKIFGQVIPTSREKIFPSSKFYVILNFIPSDINVCSLMNSEKWHMVKSTVAHSGYAIHFLNSIYRAIKSKYRAINGKLVRSHVIGCQERCFRGLDDNGRKVGKFFLSREIHKPAK